MAYGQAGSILRHIRTILDTQASRGLTDSQLLERFVSRRDESAFGVLMQRHGRLAWSVCRNILHLEQDAEDAFQATFLVLARRAASIRKGESVGSWLYGVAHRVAMKAKKTAAKRWRYERDATTKNREATSSELALRELQAVLHEELERLPEKYRTPFVLCCLEGRSRKEVAEELGWKEGTVSSRIAQARQQLQRRLTRRGVALSAVLCATAVVPNAASAALAAKTIQEVMLDAVGQGKIISAQVATLADGVVKAMALGKAKIGMVVVWAVSLVGAGVGLSANQAFQPKSQATGSSASQPPAVTAAALPEPEGTKSSGTDLYGDPLPEGVVARLGTIRLRQQSLSGSLPAAFSPDGKMIATGGNGSPRLWDTATGKLLREIRDDYHPGNLLFSPNGKMLAVRGEKSLCLRDPATGRVLQRLPTELYPVAFSPDSKLLVTWGSEEGSVCLWETGSGRQAFQLKGDQRVGLAAFTTDGRTLVTFCSGNKICRWDVATGMLKKSLEIPVRLARTSRLSLDAQTLAEVPYSREAVCLWDTETGKKKFELQGELAHAGYSLAFSPDGKTLATGWSEDWAAEGTVSLWDAGTGKIIRRFQAPARAITDLQFAPDGRTLLGSGGKPHLHLWDTVTGQELLVTQAHDESITALAFTPDGQRVVSCGDATVRLWETSTGRPLRVVARDPQLGLSSMALTPDGRAVLWGGTGLRLNELATGKELRSFVIDEHPEKLPKLSGVRSGHWTSHIGLSADGRRATSLSSAPRQLQPNAFGSSYVLHIWDVATAKALVRRDLGVTPPWFMGERPGIKFIDLNFLGFSPSLRALAAWHFPLPVEGPVERNTSDGRLIEIQDTLTGRNLVSLPQPEDFGDVYAFSPDERMFVTTTNGVKNNEYGPETLHFWELATGKERLIIRSAEAGEEHLFVQIAFGRDGRTLATARRNGTLQLWDTVTGKELFRRAGSDSRGMPLALSPDGKLLITGCPDTTILVWDLGTAKQPDALVGGQPGKKELEGWWSDLAGSDAAKADRAIWCLAAVPTQSVPMLRDYLRPAEQISADEVKRLIEQLNSKEFQKREVASCRLAEFADQIEPLLEAGLKAKPTLEQRRRIQTLLTGSWVVHSPQLLRCLRAVEVLEHIASPQAREILQTLANGPPAARLTTEAQAALERLAPTQE